MVNDMESVVVKTNTMVAKRNRYPKIVPKGSCSVIAIIAAGGPSLVKASEIAPGFFSSWNIPVPPTTVNQNVVIIGAITATTVTICLIVLPRDIRLTNIAIIDPYSINNEKKKIIYKLNHITKLTNIIY